MTVELIVKAWLQANGFDGLYTDDCGCGLDDLFPCGDYSCISCKPAYRHDAPECSAVDCNGCPIPCEGCFVYAPNNGPKENRHG